MEAKNIKISLVNKFYPPANAITGQNLFQLNDYLISNGFSTNVYCIDSSYSDNKRLEKKHNHNVKYLNFNHKSNNKIKRLFYNFIESYILIKNALKNNPEILITQTDPPFLNLFVSLLKPKKTNWISWTMDLYPQAFVSAGLVSSNNLLYKLTLFFFNIRKPDLMINLGNFQKDYLKKEYNRDIESVIWPCGVFIDQKIDNISIPDWHRKDKIIFGYCGNIGEAHSSDFLIKFVECIKDFDFILVLALYGSKANEVISQIPENDKIINVPFVNREHLKFIDIHIVSLIEEWTNICVPSKAVSAVCNNSAFIYNGIQNSDNWDLLKEAGWIINNNESIVDQINEVLKSIDKSSLESKKNKASQITEILSDIENRAKKNIVDYIFKFTSPNHNEC